jgi:hypothetical protein
MRKEAFLTARALPSRTRDLSLSARMAAERGGLRRPAIPDLNRRSGRVPALPCPPSRPRQYKPTSGWISKNVCRDARRQVITTLVLVQFRWPVLKWPRMAGFQVATEAASRRVRLTGSFEVRVRGSFKRQLLYDFSGCIWWFTTLSGKDEQPAAVLLETE